MVFRLARKYPTLLFLLVTSCYWASMYVYVPTMPVHAENLGASMGLIGTIVGAYGIFQLLLRIPLGVWSDRIGLRKPFILGGIAMAGIGALGLGLSPQPEWLVVWRAVAGMGAAAWVAFSVFFSSYFPQDKVARAMGYVSFASSGSQLVATYAGGRIAENWGWEAPFFAGAIMAVLGLLIALPLEEKPLVVQREMNLKEIQRIATTPLLLVVSIACMLIQWAQWGTSSGFTLVYASHLGATRSDLGMLTTVVYIGHMPAALLIDRIAGRFGSRMTAFTGLILQAVAIAMVPMTDSVSMIALTQVIGGVGRGLTYPLLMALSIQSVPARDRATAMGVFQAIYALGMFAGPASVGLLADSFGLLSVFAISTAACLAGAALIISKVPSKL
ncbi:MAG: MFS transporter [Chloroflexota bacterium]